MPSRYRVPLVLAKRYPGPTGSLHSIVSAIPAIICLRNGQCTPFVDRQGLGETRLVARMSHVLKEANA